MGLLSPMHKKIPDSHVKRERGNPRNSGLSSQQQMVVNYPRTVWKNSYAEHEVTGKTYNNKKKNKKRIKTDGCGKTDSFKYDDMVIIDLKPIEVRILLMHPISCNRSAFIRIDLTYNARITQRIQTNL